LIISRSSPTSLSVYLAEIAGITIIGYARRSSFRIYTYPNRITITKDIELMPSN
jgi:formate dehydrogenase accessory protein FdhD